jgi:Uri superfamily endonuclease
VIVRVPAKKESGRKARESRVSAGTYIYTGSVMAGLRDLLLRHPRDQKKRRWHIDYFLNDKQARIKKIFLYLAAPGQDAVSRISTPVYF